MKLLDLLQSLFEAPNKEKDDFSDYDDFSDFFTEDYDEDDDDIEKDD